MPKINVSGKNIYYEEYGEGQPVVFLNGIMMSTASWRPFADLFSKEFKAVFVDLIDQGESDKGDEPYTQDIHVEMLKVLFQKLGFEKVNLLGISYGGEVALKFALKYQEMLSSLILSNVTAYTNKLMNDIEDAWDYAASLNDGRKFFKATMPFIYSTEFYEKKIEWLKAREELFTKILTPEWYAGFRRAVKSASNLNVIDDLHNIKIPVLIIGAEHDAITPVRYQEEIQRRIDGSKFVVIKGCGHASMYEKPCEFASIITGYLKTYNEEIVIP